jgi:hypothetical protein
MRWLLFHGVHTVAIYFEGVISMDKINHRKTSRVIVSTQHTDPEQYTIDQIVANNSKYGKYLVNISRVGILQVICHQYFKGFTVHIRK